MQATTRVDPEEEHARLKACSSLRSRLHKACSGAGVKVPLLAFERWVARWGLVRDSGGLGGDPLLPSAEGGMHEEGLVRDLVRAGMGSDKAAEAARELGKASMQACERVRGASTGDKEIFVDTRGGITRLSLGAKDAKPYLQVNLVHVVKLQELWRRAQGRTEVDEKAFSRDLYSLVARYEGLGGHGYQAALAEEGFDVLLEGMGVRCEAFASPLNSRYSSFCSAFPDVDAPFGSLGSFFVFRPTEGSFEANPPFVPEVMLRMAEHMSDLLAASKAPLSFTVIVPVWRDLPYWDSLKASPFSRREAYVISAERHGFCDGAQHQRRKEERHRVSSFDTGVFFLQNERGAERWPVSGDVIAKLEKAMRGAVGTAKDIAELEKRYRGEGGKGHSGVKGEHTASGEGHGSSQRGDVSTECDRWGKGQQQKAGVNGGNGVAAPEDGAGPAKKGPGTVTEAVRVVKKGKKRPIPEGGGVAGAGGGFEKTKKAKKQ